ncbi:unnamed protein product [Arctogadus glacialis]
MCVLLWVVLAIGVLLCPAQASDGYSRLDQSSRAGVDLVVQQLHAHVGVQAHFLFFRSVEKFDIEAGFGARHILHHFLLKPTTCAKGTTPATAETCPFRNDRPLMDCTVCYKMFRDEIEAEPKPYVHCIQKPKLTQMMKQTRRDHCRRMSYTRGAPTLLASTQN